MKQLLLVHPEGSELAGVLSTRQDGLSLREVLDEIAPKDRFRIISEAAQWSRVAPDSSW